MVSGLFLARVIDRDWRTYGDKRVVHFLYFYLLWLVIQSAFKYGQLSGGSPIVFLEHLAFALVEPYSTLWFVYLLAVFSIVTKLCRHASPLLLLGTAALLEIAPIETPWFLLNEFCERWIYFLAGYLFAPVIFRIAAWAAQNGRAALAGLAGWVMINGAFAFTPSPFRDFPTLASLPVVSLLLGVAGGVAIVTTASLLTQAQWARPFRYCGQKSIAIYLAFFLPMAVTRTVLVKTGIITDVGVIATLVTAAAVIVPLILERLVRNTPANILFRRPAWAHIGARKPLRLQPAE